MFVKEQIQFADFVGGPDVVLYENLINCRFNVGEDCPVFDGLYEFCQLSSGGSVASAVKLNKQVRTS